MKLLKTVLALFTLLIISQISYSQVRLGLGIEGGVDIANVSVTPDFTTSTRTGIIIGGIVDIGLTPTIGITSGIRYNQKGFTFTGATVTGAAVTATDKLSYIEFPVLLKVKFPLTEVKPYVIGGPVLGIQVAANQEVTGAITQTSDISSDFQSIDFGLLFGAGLDFKVGLKTNLFVQGAYSIGLSNILKNATTQTLKNNGIQLTGGVKFNL